MSSPITGNRGDVVPEVAYAGAVASASSERALKGKVVHARVRLIEVVGAGPDAVTTILGVVKGAEGEPLRNVLIWLINYSALAGEPLNEDDYVLLMDPIVRKSSVDVPTHPAITTECYLEADCSRLGQVDPTEKSYAPAMEHPAALVPDSEAVLALLPLSAMKPDRLCNVLGYVAEVTRRQSRSGDVLIMRLVGLDCYSELVFPASYLVQNDIAIMPCCPLIAVGVRSRVATFEDSIHMELLPTTFSVFSQSSNTASHWTGNPNLWREATDVYAASAVATTTHTKVGPDMWADMPPMVQAVLDGEEGNYVIAGELTHIGTLYGNNKGLLVQPRCHKWVPFGPPHKVTLQPGNGLTANCSNRLKSNNLNRHGLFSVWKTTWNDKLVYRVTSVSLCELDPTSTPPATLPGSSNAGPSTPAAPNKRPRMR
ncbi:hypothetical protein HYH03_019057 [Edaphochlamys debaryana]|uniref:Uncharacterized protein n=1 Tax=Edaphochlamys debaryana TaxID=47281 RepID=A0A836BMD0_9CHLO|nr:hypothetical protein HYH03_019057 [Edaphochlamys debaryana]|eukprot:KAG2481991.1 hypothetical protein HYH03_019057 [Edaphochlamys debaryana]